jgi:hypothetical protein
MSVHPEPLQVCWDLIFLLYPQGKIKNPGGRGVTYAPALLVIGLWIVLQLFSGIGSLQSAGQQGGVAYMAHIGGFVAGLLLTFLFRGKTAGPCRVRDIGTFQFICTILSFIQDIVIAHRITVI